MTLLSTSLADVFRALHPPQEAREWPPTFYPPSREQPVASCCTTGRPLYSTAFSDRWTDASPLDTAVKWLMAHARISWSDARNFAERAKWDSRWGELRLAKPREIVERMNEARKSTYPHPQLIDIESNYIASRWQLDAGGVMPSVLHVVERIEKRITPRRVRQLLEILQRLHPQAFVELGLWLPAGEQAATGRKFRPTELQQRILDRLDGKAATSKTLQNELRAKNTFYRPNGINGLLKEGLVRKDEKLGYYRPDASPLELADYIALGD